MSSIKPIRQRLGKISHSVRAAQAILQYGVGAMVDFPDQTLMTAAPEFWVDDKRKLKHIHDERLEKQLGVNFLGIPFDGGVSDLREWPMSASPSGIFAQNVAALNP